MKTKALKSWEEFEEELGALIALRKDRKRTKPSVAEIVYRGHCNACWPLDTSLERNGWRKPRCEGLTIA